jgi:hypothetical protein
MITYGYAVGVPAQILEQKMVRVKHRPFGKNHPFFLIKRVKIFFVFVNFWGAFWV